MKDDLSLARDHVELARLLDSRVGLRDHPDVRERYRQQLELAKMRINMALNSLERAEDLCPETET